MPNRRKMGIGGLRVHLIDRIWRWSLLVLSLLGVLFVLATTASANDSQAVGAEVYQAYEYRMAGDRQRMRVILYVDKKPEVTWFLLRAPHRLVIDLPETRFAIDQDATKPRGMITDVNYGRIGVGHSRMIFSIDGPFSVDELSVVENEQSPGYRMIVDIVAASEADFDQAMRNRIAFSSDDDHSKEKPAKLPEDGRFTVVLDAGHGGIDSGARGVNGTLEKTITLAFALELRNKLEQTSDYKVLLTRTKDVFLRLDERVRIARQNGADLFLSIHADSIRLRNFNGATVYTLSDEASDAEAAATAARENLSDSLAGMVPEDEKDEVTGILADLIRRETHVFSIRFARTIIDELSPTVEFVNNPLRSAGFRVLRAPDVPSILLELGYLSNPQEEKRLRDPEWRERSADELVKAIGLFAEAKAGTGG